MNYGEFGPDAQLAVKDADLQQFTERTIELYVKITSEKGIDFLNVTNSGVELVALKKSACFGLGNGGTITAELFATDEWIHIVSAIGNSEKTAYVNGVEVGNNMVEADFIGSTSTTYVVRYFRESGVNVAIFGLYEVAANAEEAAGLYKAVSGDSAAEPTEDLAATPEASPKAEPTAEPTAKPTTVPIATPAPDGGISGATIAIIIVAADVVIGEVVVIIIVIRKKVK